MLVKFMTCDTQRSWMLGDIHEVHYILTMNSEWLLHSNLCTRLDFCIESIFLLEKKSIVQFRAHLYKFMQMLLRYYAPKKWGLYFTRIQNDQQFALQQVSTLNIMCVYV